MPRPQAGNTHTAATEREGVPIIMTEHVVLRYAVACVLAALVLASTGLAAGAGLNWRCGATMPTPVGGHCVAAVGNQILCAGGNTWHGGKKYWLRDITLYDIPTNQWRPVGQLPEPLGDALGLGTGDSLIVLGGSDKTTASDRCYQVRLQAGRAVVDRLPSLPAPRVYAAGGRVGNTLYVVGGSDDPAKLENATATLFALDLKNTARGWQTLAPLPGRARVVFAGAASGGKLYVFGGCLIDEQKVVRNLADAYCYDPRADQWERLPDAPASNRGLTAATDGQGRVLLCGGFTATEEECAGKGNDFGFTDEVLRYDPAARTYTPVGKLPKPTATAGPARCGDTLFLLGGENIKRGRGDWVWITDLK